HGRSLPAHLRPQAGARGALHVRRAPRPHEGAREGLGRARAHGPRSGRGVTAMQLLDRIEKRRFVGREFLLWLWFESEVFEATLSTKEHGDFGLWIEKQRVLSEGKEATRIKGATPSASREPKESLLRGKLPESAGIHLSMGEKEMTFTLKAEQLAVAGLSLPT